MKNLRDKKADGDKDAPGNEAARGAGNGGGNDDANGSSVPEHGKPRYRGLYLADRPVALGAGSPREMHKGRLSDLELLYPEELSRALGQMNSLSEDMRQIRKKNRKPNNRDRVRLALMDAELTVVKRRLNSHDQRVRGAFREVSQYVDTIGKGFEEYLVSLANLLFFLENCQSRIKGLVLIIRGTANKAMSKKLLASLYQELDIALTLSLEIVPPESWEGRKPLRKVIPDFPYLPPQPVKPKKLLELARVFAEKLETARLAALDALLICEKNLLVLFERSKKEPLLTRGPGRAGTPDQAGTIAADRADAVDKTAEEDSDPSGSQ
ncbi:MAG: hypothetical protein LBF41_10330, partial [Deltaproteobacteria bacterium]|nr:hypothetical protein [Deltaproteobacteria bacterium]